MNNKKVLWVTGPVASGKNEICKVLKQKGFFIIDADKIGHKILNKKKAILAKAFGKEIISKNSVDRKKLGKIVFLNKSKLKKLNSIVHPFLKKEIANEIKKAKSSKIVVNASLHRQLKKACKDAIVISVLSSKKLRLKRLVNKRKLDRNLALAIMNSQEKDSYYRKVADFVVWNNKSLSYLKSVILSILKSIES